MYDAGITSDSYNGKQRICKAVTISAQIARPDMEKVIYVENDKRSS
jgi:hypothetical protein